MSSPAGFKNALDTFHKMANQVPAYKDFLKRHRVDATKIKTHEDFEKLPVMDKHNYLREYPLAELCWQGSLADVKTISQSSGSTGDPFFWPHGSFQHEEGVDMHKEIFERIFKTHKKPTLVVVCFSMGTWIAGPFTMISMLGVSNHHEVLNTITPGIDKEDAVRAVMGLEKNYERIVICGYPPFAKDVFEALVDAGIEVVEDKVSFLFAGENLGEEWRDYVLGKARVSDKLHGSVNVYGSADATILGHESPLTISLRKNINRRGAKVIKQYFGQEVLPSLMQYYPDRRYFEAIGDKLIFSANSGIPLIRYDIGDSGRLFKPGELLNEVVSEDSSFSTDEITDFDHWNKLPMVAIGGRRNLTVSLYGLLIYPENIKVALVHKDLNKLFSGRFTMEVTTNADMEQYFRLNIEAKKGVNPENINKHKVKETIIKTLVEVNSEYRKLLRSVGVVAEPHITIHNHGDEYINKGKIKQRWVKRS